MAWASSLSAAAISSLAWERNKVACMPACGPTPFQSETLCAQSVVRRRLLQSPATDATASKALRKLIYACDEATSAACALMLCL